MTEFVIQLNSQFADKSNGYTDWAPALQAVAYEIQQLNTFVGQLGIDDYGNQAFPRPISCNPDAVYQEQIQDEVTTEIVVPESTILLEDGTEEIIPEHTETDTKLVPRVDIEGNPVMQWVGQYEKVIGDTNTVPTDDGMILVTLNNYDWINFKFLPQMPTTFSIIGGMPPHIGKKI